MTIREAEQSAAQRLRLSGVPDPEIDARLLLCAVTGMERMALRMSAAMPLTPQQEQRFSSLLLCRASRQPLQYILGKQCFYGLDFAVDARALIPRQETETLCELGVHFLRGLHNPSALDLCTGSGAIAVALKRECPAATVCATDLSEDALEVARNNALANGAEVRFLRGDLFAPVSGERFDLILSNPPYIPSDDCDSLQPEVMREPRMALDGGDDGLCFYRRIAGEAKAHLMSGGMLAVEVGDGQAADVQKLLMDAGLGDVCAHSDLYGHERVVSALYSGTPT